MLELHVLFGLAKGPVQDFRRSRDLGGRRRHIVFQHIDIGLQRLLSVPSGGFLKRLLRLYQHFLRTAGRVAALAFLEGSQVFDPAGISLASILFATSGSSHCTKSGIEHVNSPWDC